MNVFGKIEWLRVARTFGFHNVNHRGNDFTGFLDHNRVADPDVFAFDFVFVVQGRAGDGAATYQHWLERSHWRKNSSPPDLNDDVVQPSLDAFGRVFVS